MLERSEKVHSFVVFLLITVNLTCSGQPRFTVFVFFDNVLRSIWSIHNRIFLSYRVEKTIL
jgi:hypothetical protein